MKKTILTSVLTSIMFLFIGNFAFAQSTTPEEGVILEFLPVVNKTKLPADIANKLHAEIKKHVSTWNRLTVVADIPDAPDMMPLKSKAQKVKTPNDAKPAPTKVPSTVAPTTKQKGNTVAVVNITSFKAASGGADVSMAKQKAGLRAQIKGVVVFKEAGKETYFDKVEFSGDYVMANKDQATATGANIQMADNAQSKSKGKSAKGKSDSTRPSKGMKQEVLREACKRAFADFKNKAKYAFTSDLELTRVLEGKSGDALTVEMVGGNMLDVKEGYNYDIYVLKPTGPKQTETSMIGNIVVLQSGGTKSVAKIVNGKDMIHSMLHGENKMTVYAKLVEPRN